MASPESVVSCRLQSSSIFRSAFKQECSALCATNGDAALTASDYDRAIDLYSAAINLNPASDAVFANRSKAKLGKMLWMEALLDAQKVVGTYRLITGAHCGNT
jgi:hypothetical protein